jgi:hypothetical protein
VTISRGFVSLGLPVSSPGAKSLAIRGCLLLLFFISLIYGSLVYERLKSQ